jgi:dipeptidyl aminopeptidase/acylaminoacyl peptidase
MTYADTAQWRSISGQKLSANGGWLGYGLFPQDADGEVVLRNLSTDAELRSPAGLRPPPPAPDPEREGPPTQPTTQLTFTSDSSFAVFTTFAPKANPKAKPGLVIANLKAATLTSLEAVKSYQLAVDGGNFVAYLKDDDAKTLVLRALASGVDRTVTGVTEYALSKDGQTLVYATGKAVLVWNTANPAAQPAALTDAEAKYTRLTWDEKNTHLAFTSPTELYLWDRRPGKARSLGVRLGYALSANGTLSFSRDGARLYFPTAPIANDPKPDGVNFDLWHWQDEQIQPMQKIRAGVERKRSYRAVYHLASNRAIQLATVEMPEVSPAESGLWAIGLDDRPYRAAIDYEESRLADHYLVNLQTGERKLLGEKRPSSYSWSPDGRYAIRFDDLHWKVLNAATGVEVNITRHLKVAFHNEDHDSPGRPGPYAGAQWTRDSKSILLADRYDLWQLNPDGSNPRNLTAGLGRQRQIQFRIVRTDSEERQEGLDPAQPLLLRAESIETRDTGFFVQTLDGGNGPRQLAWANRHYAAPVKAKGADVLMLTASTYRDYPDILITNSQMQSFRKVTEANPQLAEYRWGTSELMPFRSADGTPLQAALYKPEGFDPKKKYPVMVYLYERLSQNVNNFPEPRPTNSINIGIYVSNGYIVLTPDIIYREGYPGDSALNCVMPAVQKLIEQGYVDEKRIGIQGHSWGGYQIAYMLTRTNLFRAASAGAAVVNMISAYNGIRWGPGRPRQFQYERTQSRIGGTPWQYPLRFIDNSPVFRADQIQTPIMTIHNDADDAVPWYQGIEFYLSLRRLGKEIYLFNYNGEPHNLRQRPNQVHYSERMLEYFNHFLQDAPKPAWMVRGRKYLEREAAAPPKPSDLP